MVEFKVKHYPDAIIIYGRNGDVAAAFDRESASKEFAYGAKGNERLSSYSEMCEYARQYWGLEMKIKQPSFSKEELDYCAYQLASFCVMCTGHTYPEYGNAMSINQENSDETEKIFDKTEEAFDYIEDEIIEQELDIENYYNENKIKRNNLFVSFLKQILNSLIRLILLPFVIVFFILTKLLTVILKKAANIVTGVIIIFGIIFEISMIYLIKHDEVVPVEFYWCVVLDPIALIIVGLISKESEKILNFISDFSAYSFALLSYEFIK